MYEKFTSKLYKLWINKRFQNKGAFVPEWDDYDNFENWAYANGYEEGARLKRLDKTKPFGPTNCQFLLGKTEYNTPLYRIWVKMCYRSKYEVCAEWKQFPNFEAWALANGYNPDEQMDLYITRAYKYDSFTGVFEYMWHPICVKFERKRK